MSDLRTLNGGRGGNKPKVLDYTKRFISRYTEYTITYYKNAFNSITTNLKSIYPS